IPLLDSFGVESNSVGVTDAQGRFQLTCQYNSQPGAVVGEHVVLISEPPLPDNLRKVQDSGVIDRYRATRGNRPIPVDYTTLGTSPLRVEVKEGQAQYDLELKR